MQVRFKDMDGRDSPAMTEKPDSRGVEKSLIHLRPGLRAADQAAEHAAGELHGLALEAHLAGVGLAVLLHSTKFSQSRICNLWRCLHRHYVVAGWPAREGGRAGRPRALCPGSGL